VALNRAIALGRVEGPDAALVEIEKIRKDGRLKGYMFLEAAAADLHRQAGRADEARTHFDRALALARNDRERHVLQAKLTSLTLA
jgi:predicted RNA polymerase sigma factor